MSVRSNNSDGMSMTLEDHPPALDAANFATIVAEWKKLQDEYINYRQAMNEKAKRMKVLEAIIMSTMRTNSLGALNLNSSGGRILYKKSTSKESLAPKTLERLLGEHFKDQGKVAETMKFINENRGSKVREAIKFEPNTDFS